MLCRHCSRAEVWAGACMLLSASIAAAAQPAPANAPVPGAVPFTIFVRSTPVGSEQIAVHRSADGWTIQSSGRVGAPLDAVARRIQVRYTAEWQPVEFSFDGTVRGEAQSIHTLIDGEWARSEIVVAGQTTRANHTIAGDTLVVLPNTFLTWRTIRLARGHCGRRFLAPTKIGLSPSSSARCATRQSVRSRKYCSLWLNE